MKEQKEIDLKSSISSSYFLNSKTVTQVFHFKDGVKRTFTGIKPETIKQGQYTKMMTDDGRLLIINDSNVLCIEIFEEE